MPLTDWLTADRTSHSSKIVRSNTCSVIHTKDTLSQSTYCTLCDTFFWYILPRTVHSYSKTLYCQCQVIAYHGLFYLWKIQKIHSSLNFVSSSSPCWYQDQTLETFLFTAVCIFCFRVTVSSKSMFQLHVAVVYLYRVQCRTTWQLFFIRLQSKWLYYVIYITQIKWWLLHIQYLL